MSGTLRWRLSGTYLKGEDILGGRLALQHFPRLLL